MPDELCTCGPDFQLGLANLVMQVLDAKAVGGGVAVVVVVVSDSRGMAMYRLSYPCRDGASS